MDKGQVGLKFNFNDSFSKDYTKCLDKFKEIDFELFSICEDISDKWVNATDISLNYNLFEELILNFEKWVKKRKTN